MFSGAGGGLRELRCGVRGEGRRWRRKEGTRRKKRKREEGREVEGVGERKREREEGG